MLNTIYNIIGFIFHFGASIIVGYYLGTTLNLGHVKKASSKGYIYAVLVVMGAMFATMCCIDFIPIKETTPEWWKAFVNFMQVEHHATLYGYFGYHKKGKALFLGVVNIILFIFFASVGKDNLPLK